MSRLKKLVRAAIACALASGGMVVASGGSALANGCAQEYYYSYTSPTVYHFDMVPPSSAPPGHTLSIQLTAGLTVTATFGGEVSGDASIIVAGLKAQVNASVAMSLTASITYGDSWTVPSGVSLGYLHAGALRQKANWSYKRVTPQCTTQVVRTGTANVPYHIPSFWSTTT